MIRNFKALLLAAMAVTAFSAVAVSAAHAAQFTNPAGGNTVLTAEADGTGTASHHVFDVPGNGSITCNETTFTQTVTGNPLASITAIPSWDVCKFLGQTATVSMKGCEFVFKPNGEVEVGSATGKNCATEPIQFSIPTCTVKVGPQKLTGITYKNTGNTVTLSALVKKISGEALAGCPVPGVFTTGEYTTGNTIIKGEEDPGTTEKTIAWDA